MRNGGDYCIVQGDSTMSLVAEARKLVKQGYSPTGGPLAVTDTQGNSILLQAMFRPPDADR